MLDIDWNLFGIFHKDYPFYDSLDRANTICIKYILKYRTACITLYITQI
jgi:hypothetical protein